MSENRPVPIDAAAADTQVAERQSGEPRSQSWSSPEGSAPPVPVGLLGWVVVALKAPLLLLVVFGGLLLLLLLRLIERPIWKLQRPLTPWITVAVCKLALLILGLRHEVQGEPMRGRGAVVANHASWLDIFSLNAAMPLYFAAKSEVAGWPGIGWLAKATGTLFIRRDAREARVQSALFEARLRAGHRLCFFPEGTSTDGLRVIAFKPTLFAAFFAHGLAGILRIQPVTIAYQAPPGMDPRFYGWFDEMGFATHLLRVLSRPRQGRVTVIFHPPVAVADFPGRKELSRHCEEAVRAGLRETLPPEQFRA